MEKCTIFRENRMRNRFQREKKQLKTRKMQKVTKKWPDTPLWLIDKPMGKFRKNVWDSVLDLIFCTPFRYMFTKVMFSLEKSSLCSVTKRIRLKWKGVFCKKYRKGVQTLRSSWCPRFWGGFGNIWEALRVPWGGGSDSRGVQKAQVGPHLTH